MLGKRSMRQSAPATISLHEATSRGTAPDSNNMNLLSGKSKFVVLAAIALSAVAQFRAFAQFDKVFSFQTVDGPVNALRAYDTSNLGTTAPEALTAAYHLPGDGGGNRFYWSSSSMLPDNGG